MFSSNGFVLGNITFYSIRSASGHFSSASWIYGFRLANCMHVYEGSDEFIWSVARSDIYIQVVYILEFYMCYACVGLYWLGYSSRFASCFVYACVWTMRVKYFLHSSLSALTCLAALFLAAHTVYTGNGFCLAAKVVALSIGDSRQIYTFRIVY